MYRRQQSHIDRRSVLRGAAVLIAGTSGLAIALSVAVGTARQED